MNVMPISTRLDVSVSNGVGGVQRSDVVRRPSSLGLFLPCRRPQTSVRKYSTLARAVRRSFCATLKLERVSCDFLGGAVKNSRLSSSSRLWSARTPLLRLTRGPVLSTTGVALEPGASEEYVADQDRGVDDSNVLTGDGIEMQSTLKLVETAMLAATAGLAFFLSNLFRLEGYFGCFFPLPVVISSMRWGAVSGRKTMMATALLLLILSGPLKAASYLLMHGFVGLALGALWRYRVNWFLSLIVCTVVRCFGSLGFVLLSSWLLRENLLRLITINAHASISYMLAAVGINVIPTMFMIYVIFGILLFLNCGTFVFLLHVLYVILLKRLNIETKIAAPGWIQRAI